MAVNTVIVDDNDSRITFNGPWILGGNASVEFDGTTHRTLTAGATATFMFSGTSVSVFGTITSLSVSPVNPSSTYSIDGSKVATFAPTEDNSIHYMQQLFQSPPLASGSHTLVITSNVDNGYLFLDFIQFTPSSNTSPTTLTKTTTIPPSASQSTASVTLTTSSQITTSLSQGSLGTSIIITQGSNTPVSSTTSQSSNSTLSQSSSFSVPATSIASSSRSSKAPVGAIVGGVIAAAALVVIAAIALCLIRRSRRTRQGWQNSGSTMTPFQNAAQGGSDSNNAIREVTNVGLRTALRLPNPRDGKTLTNLHSQGHSSPISPGLQSTLTTEVPRYLQNHDQEVASSTDVDSPPEYDYGASRRPLEQVHGHSRSL